MQSEPPQPNIEDLIESKARSDAGYAIAFALLQLARAQEASTHHIKNLGNGNASTDTSAVEASGMHTDTDVSIKEVKYNEYSARFFVENPFDTIQKHHARGEFYEVKELEIMSRYFPRGGRLIDIGSNVGNHCIFCCKVLGASRVIVIEPNPKAIEILKKNIEINNLAAVVDVSFLGFGLSDAPGVASATTPRGNLGGTRLTTLSEMKNDSLRLVAGDWILMDQAVDFIKMDVEGMEIKALNGLEKTIKKNRPPMFIEVDDVNAKVFLDWIEENNYQIFEKFRRYHNNENYLILSK
jgi:FkbM family methyltransferase